MKQFLVAATFLFVSSAGIAQTAPTLFFTDLISGPNSGGESVGGFAGAYVTIYGNNFGTSPTVTLNGGSCLRIVSVGGNQVNTWLWYQKMVVQLGASCVSGNLSVTTINGNSNVLAFTVRTGNIFCVSTTGNDASTGRFPSSCWRTILNAKNTMVAGDISYIENGVSQTSEDTFSAAVVLGSSGTSAKPLALVVYPGAVSTIGAVGLDQGIRGCAPGLGACGTGTAFWVIAGFTLRAATAAISLSPSVPNTWWIGNDISCPPGNSSSACVTTNQDDNVFFYGNNAHDSGPSNAIKTYHETYFNGDNTPAPVGLFIGWNSIHDGGACRGIQIRPNAGNYTDVHVHDNRIFNIRCDGINAGAVDPTSSTIELYNNVIYNAGKGPDPSDGAADYACIRISGPATTSAHTVKIYNNTLYNCGSGGTTNNGQGPLQIDNTNGTPDTYIANNIIQQVSPENYLSAGSGVSCAQWFGGNNMWFGASGGNNPPCSLTGDRVGTNPLLVSVATADFHLQSGSPSIGTGTNAAPIPVFDLDGLLRSSPPSVGAFEFAASTPSVAIPRMSGTATVSGSSVMK